MPLCRLFKLCDKLALKLRHVCIPLLLYDTGRDAVDRVFGDDVFAVVGGARDAREASLLKLILPTRRAMLQIESNPNAGTHDSTRNYPIKSYVQL